MIEYRSSEQVREHYEIEKELAYRLRNASQLSRKELYVSVYDELFKKVPHHPQLTQKISEEDTARSSLYQFALLRRFLNPQITYLEIGPGDCRFAMQVAQRVKHVVAIDVSDEITRSVSFPKNFNLVLSDGCSIPVDPGSVDVAYSNQLMEHLHPDDALKQLENVFSALAPGGLYICCTPNRLTGPHDVSKGFDLVATGLHLKEYSLSDLVALFGKVGFSGFRCYVGVRSFVVRVPVGMFMNYERFLSSSLAPRGGRLFRIFRSLSNIRLIAARPI